MKQDKPNQARLDIRGNRHSRQVKPTSEKLRSACHYSDWIAMRHSKLKSTVTLRMTMIEGGEPSDERLAHFLSHVLLNCAPDFWQHLISKDSNRRIAVFGELVELAKAVKAHGNEYDDVLEINENGATPPRVPRRFPTTFRLPGFAGYQEFGKPRNVLSELAFFLDNHRDQIVRNILVKEKATIDKIELAEALAIAQAVVDRDCGDEEVEACDPTHSQTRVAQLAERYKAEFYSTKLSETLAK